MLCEYANEVLTMTVFRIHANLHRLCKCHGFVIHDIVKIVVRSAYFQIIFGIVAVMSKHASSVIIST